MHSKNGLKDKIDKKVIDIHDKTSLPIYIDTSLEDFSLEVAFEFLSNSVDKPYLKSYVNSRLSVDNGTHVDGVIKGIQGALRAYLMELEVLDDYLITRAKIVRYMLLMVQIKMYHPNYAGCVRDKLISEYVEKPISTYVKQVVLDELKKYKFEEMEFLNVFKKSW